MGRSKVDELRVSKEPKFINSWATVGPRNPLSIRTPVPTNDAELRQLSMTVSDALKSLDRRRLVEAGCDLGKLLGATGSKLRRLGSSGFLLIEIPESLIGLPLELVTIDGQMLLSERRCTGRQVLTGRVRARPEYARTDLPLPIRVLIVLDSSLPHARVEGERLRQYFSSHPDCAQPLFCTDLMRGELLDRIAQYRPDILHFAGHGVGSADDESENGWKLAGGVLNSQFIDHHLDESVRWPLLTFANACPTHQAGARDPRFGVDNVVVAILRAGCQHCISTIAPIQDGDFAAEMATRFYDNLLSKRQAVGHALFNAKYELSHEADLLTDEAVLVDHKSVRAAHYFLYGDPSHQLLAVGGASARNAQTLRSYTIGSHFNEDALGTTSYAADETGQRFLVTIFNKDASSAALVEEYRRLYQRLAGLPVLPIEKLDEYEGEIHVVFRLDSYEPLSLSAPRSAAEALELIEQIAMAVQEVHQSDQFHGQLRYDNVWVSGCDVRLHDVGRRQALKGAGLTAHVSDATESYLSPEALRSAFGARGVASDVWSLGVLAYHLSVGEHPFESARGEFCGWREAVINGAVSDPKDIRPNFSPALRVFLLRALARTQVERFQTVVEFLSAFRRAREGEADVGGFSPALAVAMRTSESLFLLRTRDEWTTVTKLRAIAAQNNLRFAMWSLVSGLVDELDRPDGECQLDPLGAVHWLSRQTAPTLLMMLDGVALLDERQLTLGGRYPLREVARAHRSPDPYAIDSIFGEPIDEADAYEDVVVFPKAEFLREVTDLCANGFEGRPHKLVVTTPGFGVGDEVAKQFQLVVAAPASASDLEKLLTMAGVRHAAWANDFIWHALGLELSQARGVLRLAEARVGGLNEECLEDLRREKAQEVRRSGVLEYCESDVTLSRDLRGLDRFKDWFDLRALPFFDAGAMFGASPPKGVVLGGLPGTGKSLCARAIAGELRWPLLRLDLGRIFTSLLGAAEANLDTALEQAERLSPVVLWVDDLDLSFGPSAARTGVFGRVLNLLLTWLQERTNPVFLAVTVRDPNAIPPELLRAGRFDALFFFDLPGHAERAETLRETISRTGCSIDGIDFESVSVATQGLSYADLTALAEEAVLAAVHSQRAAPTQGELLELARRVPVNPTRDAEFAKVRSAWQGLAVPASSQSIEMTSV